MATAAQRANILTGHQSLPYGMNVGHQSLPYERTLRRVPLHCFWLRISPRASPSSGPWSRRERSTFSLSVASTGPGPGGRSARGRHGRCRRLPRLVVFDGSTELREVIFHETVDFGLALLRRLLRALIVELEGIVFLEKMGKHISFYTIT